MARVEVAGDPMELRPDRQCPFCGTRRTICEPRMICAEMALPRSSWVARFGGSRRHCGGRKIDAALCGGWARADPCRCTLGG